VRHYLLAPPKAPSPLGTGVRTTLRASLDIADGDDWRQCEAIANLIAAPPFIRCWDDYLSVVGPQVCSGTTD